MTVLLDSNIVIGFINGEFIPEDLASYTPTISTITIMELFGLAGMSEEEEQRMIKLLSNLQLVPVTATIAKQAGILSKTRSSKKRFDLLIAATALELDIPLITKNLKDFRRIKGLEVRERP